MYQPKFNVYNRIYSEAVHTPYLDFAPSSIVCGELPKDKDKKSWIDAEKQYRASKALEEKYRMITEMREDFSHRIEARNSRCVKDRRSSNF